MSGKTYQVKVGKKTAQAILADDLRLPIHIALGHYERATKEELNEFIIDLVHELTRR